MFLSSIWETNNMMTDFLNPNADTVINKTLKFVQKQS